MEAKPPILINFHVHTTGSDGTLTPEEMVKEAIKEGIKFMCFTDHFELPDKKKLFNAKHDFHTPEYVKEIRQIQKEYKNKIDISFGGEFDWLPPYQEWLKKEIKKEKYDYVIGSVHFLEKDGQYYSYNFGGAHGHLWGKNAEIFGGTKGFIKEYYNQVRLLAESGIYDSIGHLDAIRIYNKDSILFSEDESWYKEEVIKTLDVIAKAKMVMEINVRGLVKTSAVQYPSFWIIKEAKKRNIPITIGTDAHNTLEIGENLNKAYELAKKAGYSEIVRFKDRKRIIIPI